jgi:allene oxide cyclase
MNTVQKHQLMKRLFAPTAGFSLVAMMLAILLFMSTMGGLAASTRDNKTIHAVEHAVTDTVIDLGKKGDSLGDQLAFGNPVYDAANKKQVGTDQGICARTVVGKSWECFWTVFLPAGHITVEGPYYDTSDSMLAITGGTGAYRDAHGQMKLHARNAKGTEYDFIYDLH